MKTIKSSTFSSARTVRRLLSEVLNRGKLEVANQLLHHNYRYESPTETLNGITEFQEFVTALRSAFPDLHVSVEDILASDSRTSAKVRVTGTHLGEFFGFPATGRSINVYGVVLSDFKNGLIHREWELLDNQSLLQQLEVA